MEKQRDEILDWVRGLSALVVLLAHARGFVFRDLGELAAPTVATKVFYLVTGVHHQAVMVFFVLSGYFVGGGVLKAFLNRRFGWGRYLLARLTRLWVVLLPALIWTFVCDQIGGHFAPAAYAGEWSYLWLSGPSPGTGAADGALAFFGNLAFLQTIRVPVFGSNGPLWSLANEFWYYVIFPFLAGGVVLITGGKGLGCRVSGILWLALAALLMWWLPPALVQKGLVWLLGAGVWWLISKGMFPQRGIRPAWIVGGAALFGTTLLLSKTSSPVGSDHAVGLAFAAWMLGLGGCWSDAFSWLRPVGHFVSEISYTLYVVHFPCLFLLSATLLKGRQFVPGIGGFGWFTAMVTVSLLVAWGFWWLFERRTDAVRRFVRGEGLPNRVAPTRSK